MKKLRLPIVITLLVGLLLMLSNGFNVGGMHMFLVEKYRHHHKHDSNEPVSVYEVHSHSASCSNAHVCSEAHAQLEHECRQHGFSQQLLELFDFSDTHAEKHLHCGDHCHVSWIFSVCLAISIEHGGLNNFFQPDNQRPLMWVSDWPQLNHSDTFRPPCA